MNTPLRIPVNNLPAESVFGRAPLAFAVTEGPLHTLLYANPAFRRLQSTGEIAVGAHTSRDPPAAELYPVLDAVYHSGRAVHDLPIEFPNEPAPTWSCAVWPMAPAPDALRRLVIELHDVSLAEDERAWQRTLSERLMLSALREQDAALEASEARQRAQFLAKVSRELATSLDESTTRDAVRRLALPRPGSWVIVDVIESDGAIHRLPILHPDPTKQELARGLEALWPAAQATTDEQSSTRRPVMVGDESGEALLLAVHGEENLRILREIGFGALLVVPLIVRARVQGSMTFVSPPGDPLFSSDEIALAVDLAARCGLALDNARLYREADGLRLAAELANQSKVQFLGSMSHELRTPLNAIGGFAELIELGIEGPVNDRQRIALGRIKSNQQHLLALITEILTFARIEAGRIEYHNAEVPMGQAISEVADMLQASVTAAGMAVERPAVDPGCVVWADPVRVRQILVNLVMNAIKYAAVPTGTITFACQRSEDAVVVSVSDVGAGIPSEKLETIFEPFVQLTAGLADRRHGVGLGLAISRDLARAMGGDLAVESTVGIGSRFSLSLPLARGAGRA